MKNLIHKFLNLFFVVSCEKYCELDSAHHDRRLSRWERIAHKFHYFHCTFCRRFHKQLKVMEDVANRDDFASFDNADARLTDQQKQEISEELRKHS